MSIFAATVFLMADQSAFTPNSFPLRQSDEEVRQLYYSYGDCVVARYRRHAESAILDNVDDETLLKRRRQLVEPDCLKPAKGMTVFMGLQADRIRYAVADALVRRELSEQGVPDLTTVPALAHWDAGEPPSRNSDDGRRLKGQRSQQALRTYQERYAFSQFSRFGECVVRTGPSASRALLLTKPDSKEETAAFNTLKDALAHCIPPGATMSLAKLPLRGTVAVNYYRLAKAAESTGTAGITE